MKIKGIKPFIIGIAGGSGSGKTYLANILNQQITSLVISQDSFYKDQSDKFDFDGGGVNFDHPDSIEFSLLVKCLRELKKGKSFDVPIYDFASHSRVGTKRVDSSLLIIVEGILIFQNKKLRDLFDVKIFCDCPEDLRFKRRFDRDTQERGRSPDGVRSQFQNQVKPMHDKYVEPSKKHANLIVDENYKKSEILSIIINKLNL